MAERLPTGRDRTPRILRPRPITVGLIAISLLAGVVGTATRGGPQCILAVALIGVVVLDACVARAALSRVQPVLANPTDAIAGEPVTYVVQVRGLTRPVQLVRPASWPMVPRQALAIDAPDPGTMSLGAPARGVVTHLVFDLVAAGPLGLWESTCRVRVWFPTPLAVAPPPLADDPDWPALRTLPLGETATVARGDDLFRGVRRYVRGDARRSVHWPATAHHGVLMVKERDGLEQVSLRVVLHLPLPGHGSELAAGRAAWLVAYGLAQGWLVHLVTVEPTHGEAPPPPLGRAQGPFPIPYGPIPVTRTVERRIDHPGQARQQLAGASFGVPVVDPRPGLTRIVSPEGDAWR